MNLKRLELRGFKTFAHPTEFLFPSRITGLVGPNGSGKSNLADAVRWVLGEQSMRAVRGKRTEDVIFAGSSSRSPSGMAEVAVTLDNASGWLPVAFSEVKISRRAYRSGDNDYLLNGNKVRLRDLNDLLLRAGLGESAYAVVGQGAVDLALSLRPEERRALIDEAADVKRFHVKLHETREKLATTEHSLVRARDVIAEIAPRLAVLADQAARLRLHQQLTQEWRDLQRHWFRRMRDQLTAKIENAEARRATAEQEIVALRERLAGNGHRMEAVDAERAAAQERLGTLQREGERWRQQLEEARRRSAVLAERQQAQLRRRQELLDELASMNASLDSARQQLQDAEAACSTLERDVARTRTTLAENEEHHAAELNRHREQVEKITAQREELVRLRERTAARTDQSRALEERRAAAAQEGARRQEALAAVKAKLEEALDRAAKLREDADARGHRLADLRATAAALATTVAAADEELQQLANQSRHLTRTLDERRAQLAVLERWRDSHAAFSSGVRAVLQAAAAGPGRQASLSGVVGAVADLLRVPEHLETAIEVALGGRAQDVVVERWSDAEAGIALLKRSGAGRATFLPLDTLRVPGRPSNPLALREQGVLGVGADLVQCDHRYQTVVELLLGRTLLAESLAVARRVLTLVPAGWQIVTVDGETVRPTGAVTGGARKGGEAGLLARQREVRALRQGVAALGREGAAVAAQLAGLREAQAERRRQLLELEDRRREGEAGLRRLETTLAAVKVEADMLAEQGRRAAEACTRQAEEHARLDAQLAAAAGEVARLEQQSRDLQSELSLVEEEQRAQAAAQHGVTEQLVAQRTALAVKESALASRRELVMAQRAGLNQVAALVAERETRLADLSGAEQSVAAAVHAADEALAAATAELRQVEQSTVPTEYQTGQLARQRQSIEQEIAHCRERLVAVEAERNEALAALARLREQVEQAQQQAAGELGAAVAAEVWSGDTPGGGNGKEVSSEELRRRIDRARAALRQLGMVNPAAITEYEHTLARHEFLAGQVADLDDAARSLRRLSGELQKTMRRRFEETFRAVSAEFRQYFTRLFGGGTARLILTAPEDVEQTGVEIVAQPPGRRLQNLALLSGGERALTAVALLFAVLAVRPIPFCVLDEVDAALDEANVTRFGEALRDLAQRTQFIVITHNRATMPVVDSLYGISMSEDSISQVVSLRLADDLTEEERRHVRPAATHR